MFLIHFGPIEEDWSLSFSFFFFFLFISFDLGKIKRLYKRQREIGLVVFDPGYLIK